MFLTVSLTQPLSPTPSQPLACSPYLKFCHFQNVLCHITWFSFPECGCDTKTVGHARGRKGKVGGKRSPPTRSFPPPRGCRAEEGPLEQAAGPV